MPRKSLLTLIAGFLSLTGCATTRTPAPVDERWAAFYGEIPEASRFRNFDLLVVEDGQGPPVDQLKAQGATVLAYLSLCEVTESRPYFDRVKQEGILGPANPDWPENYLLDIRSAWWQDYVISRLAPDLLNKGYDGLMFDTLDTCVDMSEKTDDKDYIEQAASLIRRLKREYPTAKLMVNRGFKVALKAATSIDALLAESTLAAHDLKTGQSRIYAQQDQDWSWYQIRDIQKKNPNIRVYSLDYWPQEDMSGIQTLYRMQRARGFVPYVTTSDLTTLGPVL